MPSIHSNTSAENGLFPAQLLHLPDALARYTGSEVVLYCRVSEPSQVNNGSLERQKLDELQEHRAAGANVRQFCYGQESGKLAKPRLLLREAIERARKRGGFVSAGNLSRLLRAADYERRTNWDVLPTQAEIEKLLKIADGVPLATRLHPSLTPKEIHALATKRGNQKSVGRKSKIPDTLKIRILELLEEEDAPSIASIARRFDLPKQPVHRFVNEWKQYMYPAKAYAATVYRNA